MATSLASLDGLVSALPVASRQAKQFLQISLCVAVTTSLAGIGYYPIFNAFGERAAADWYRGLQWAAITALLTTMPFLGQTMQTSLERVCGTAVGGAAGVAINLLVLNPMFIALTATVSTFAFFCVFWWLGLNYAGKIGAMTMLIVSMGGFTAGTAAATWDLAVSRTSGIMAGIVVSAIVSITFYPQPAGLQLMLSLRRSFECLRDFHGMAWETAPGGVIMPPDTDSDATPPRSPQLSSPSFRRKTTFRSFQSSIHSEAIDDIFLRNPGEVKDKDRAAGIKSREIFNLVAEVRSCMSVALYERYCQVFGVHFWVSVWPMKNHSFPMEQFDDLLRAMSRAWRISWSINFALFDGFQKDTQRKLSKRLPPGLMQEVRETSDSLLASMALCFPEAPVRPHGDSLSTTKASAARLHELVELLLDLTMWNRNKARQSAAASSAKSAPMDDETAQAAAQSQREPSHGFGVLSKTLSLPARPVSGEAGLQTPSMVFLGRERAVRLENLEEMRAGVASALKGHRPAARRTLGTKPPLPLPAIPSEAKLSEHPSLADMTTSLENDVVFEDSAQGFIEEVRWVSFVFELKNFSDAIAEMVVVLQDTFSKLPGEAPKCLGV